MADQFGFKFKGEHQGFLICYNNLMAFNSDMVAYKAQWEEVNRFIEKERRLASAELRWKQLNSAYVMAMNLGLLKSKHEETKVYQIWAGLKEKSITQSQKP